MRYWLIFPITRKNNTRHDTSFKSQTKGFSLWFLIKVIGSTTKRMVMEPLRSVTRTSFPVHGKTTWNTVTGHIHFLNRKSFSRASGQMGKGFRIFNITFPPVHLPGLLFTARGTTTKTYASFLPPYFASHTQLDNSIIEIILLLLLFF